MNGKPPSHDHEFEDGHPGGVADSGEHARSAESAPPTDTFEEAFPPGLVPKRVGRYHIKRVIAVGGMGTVYEAVQENPRRPVALKVMRRGVASPSALRRFEHESQLLARLRHPGIAQVYEAGTHDDISGSVPYFAMEYIPNAKPLTDYANDRKLSTPARLRLFVSVCDAVHHGHQKGIIHRDLKPGNVLVDGQGKVKIIDFGVARSTDSDMAVTTQQTAVGQLVGTLRYMSPEQCEADPHGIDARSDVYSLGVVLYELLTGRPPYDLHRGPIIEATRVIREVNPTRLSASNVALRGDPETIATKALEKDPARRYPSVLALAEDIERYLGDEPIIARPPTIIYRTGKFARKHKVPLAVGTVVLFLLSSAVHFWREARSADMVLGVYRERAGRLARDARITEPAQMVNADEANEAIEKLSEVIEADPANSDALWARVWHYYQLGDWDGMLADALHLTERWPGVANHWHAKGFALARSGRLEEAIDAYTEGLRLRPDFGRSRLHRAETHLNLGHRESAIVDCTNTIAMDPNFAMAYALRAKVYSLQDEFEAAWDDCTRALKLDPTNSLALRVCGFVRMIRGEFEPALNAYNRGMENGMGQPEDYHNRARLHRVLGHYDLAMADHDRLVARAPEASLAYLGLGITRRFVGELEGAIDDLSRAAVLDPDLAFQCSLWIWEIRMLRGEPDDRKAAGASLAVALGEAVNPYETMLAEICLGQVTEEEAMAATTADHVGDTSYYLGARALVDGRLEDAKVWFQKCRDFREYVTPEYDLALCHLRQLGVE